MRKTRTFTYRTWGSELRHVTCERVEFQFGYVTFVGVPEDADFLVIAEQSTNCNELTEVVRTDSRRETGEAT